jgi:AcrR family transcriptional regulator
VAILDAGIALAREIGLSGLSVGALAERVGMSKSGLFAHFGSKEAIQLGVLKATQQRFEDEVARPAFAAPRGVARLNNLFLGWLAWAANQPQPGGCVILAAASEFDDRPGPVRDYLCAQQEAWLLALRRTVGFAVEADEMPANTDADQFAFEFFGLILSTHHHVRLLRNQQFILRAQAAYARLIKHPPLVAA